MSVLTRFATGLMLVLLGLTVIGVASARAEGAGLHGRVFALDEKGDVHDVVVGAKIQLLDASGAVAAQTTSGPGGYYRVRLPAGTYRYKVTAAGFEDEDVKRGVRQELTQGFSVFDFALSPKTDEPEETPGAGDEVDPPSATPIPAEIGTLYGIVHEHANDVSLVGIPGARVRLAPDDGDPGTEVETDVRGGYEIVLPAGTWRATALAPGYAPLIDADPIRITKGGRTNRDFLFVRPRAPVVPKGQGIRGTIRLLTDPDATARVVPTPTVAILPLSLKATQGAAPGVDGQGAYQSPLAVGRYEVVASATGYEPARSGPRGVHAGQTTHVDLTLRPSAKAPETTPPSPLPTPPTPDPVPTPTPKPTPDPTPAPQPTPATPPQPAPVPTPRGATLSLQALERGPDRVLRIVAGATVSTERGAGGTTDANGWCTVPLRPGGQHVQVRSPAGGSATLGIGFAPGDRFVEVERRDANGNAHLELQLPVALQVVLTREEIPETPPGPEGRVPDRDEPGKTARIVVRIVEHGPGGRGTRLVDGAHVSILLGERAVDRGIAKGGVFTSKPLPVLGGYYAFAEKEGYHPAEDATPIEEQGPFTLLLRRVEHDGEPREPLPPGEKPRDDAPPPEGGEATLQIRAVGPDDQPLAGVHVELRWGRDEIRARGITRERDGIVRLRVPRDAYWVRARLEVPGRGVAQGGAEVPRDWNPEVPILVRLQLPGADRPDEPPPPREPGQPPAEPPGRTQAAPLQIQVLGPDGRPLSGVPVEVLWGPQGRSQVRGRGATQRGSGIARFQLPRENYWARAVAQMPGGGRLVGQIAVGRNWNPAVPIRIRLHQEGGPPPPPQQPTPPRQPGAPKPPPQQPPAAKARLTVRVSGLDLNAPISTVRPLGGARVTVRGGGGSWSGVTNPGGTWGIALAPGNYQIDVTAPGMERAANASVNMGNRNVTKELTIKLRGPR